MLIAIGALVLVVVFMASKTTPGQSDATRLPDPPSIPATGSTGIPSPATMPGAHEFGTPLLGTNAGQLVMGTNSSVPAQVWRGNPPPTQPLVSTTPISVPQEAKELFTGVKSIAPGIRVGTTVPTGYTKL